MNVFNFSLFLFILFVCIILFIFFKFKISLKENLNNSDNKEKDLFKDLTDDYTVIKFFNSETYKDIVEYLEDFNKILDIIEYDNSLFFYYLDTLNNITDKIEELLDFLFLNIPQHKLIDTDILKIKEDTTKGLKKKIETLKTKILKDENTKNIDIFTKYLLFQN